MRKIFGIILLLFSINVIGMNYGEAIKCPSFDFLLKIALIYNINMDEKLLNILEEDYQVREGFDEIDFNQKIEQAFMDISGHSENLIDYYQEIKNIDLPADFSEVVSDNIEKNFRPIINMLDELRPQDKQVVNGRFKELLTFVNDIAAFIKSSNGLFNLFAINGRPWKLKIDDIEFNIFSELDKKTLNVFMESINRIKDFCDEFNFQIDYEEFGLKLATRSVVQFKDREFQISDKKKIFEEIDKALAWEQWHHENENNEVGYGKIYTLNFVWISDRQEEDDLLGKLNIFATNDRLESLNKEWKTRFGGLKSPSEILEGKLSNIKAWCERISSEVPIIIWHDRKNQDAIDNTNRSIEEMKHKHNIENDIILKSIYEILPEEIHYLFKNSGDSKNILPVYLRADLMRQMLADNNDNLSKRYMVYADFNIPPHYENYIFSQKARALLDEYGWLTSTRSGMPHRPQIELSVFKENAFFIFDLRNNEALLANRWALVGANIKRANLYLDIKQRKGEFYGLNNFSQIVFLSYESMLYFLRFLLNKADLTTSNNEVIEVSNPVDFALQQGSDYFFNTEEGSLYDNYMHFNFKIARKKEGKEEDKCYLYPTINVGKPKSSHVTN